MVSTVSGLAESLSTRAKVNHDASTSSALFIRGPVTMTPKARHSVLWSGTRGMPSGEIRLEGAVAFLVGDPQQGFKQMADMINLSRLSNGMRAAGLMRRALTEALFVARHRRAFGKPLIELPLMRRQLLKLMLPAEAARSVLFFTSKELEKADSGDENARRIVRLMTPAPICWSFDSSVSFGFFFQTAVSLFAHSPPSCVSALFNVYTYWVLQAKPPRLISCPARR